MASVRPTLLMIFLVALAVVALAAAQTQVGEVRAQSCPSQMASLNVCGPFVVPGSSRGPSSECCGALQAVEHDCLCSTLRIATSLPSACHLPPVSCD